MKKELIAELEFHKGIAREFLTCVSEARVDKLCNMITENWVMHGGLPGIKRGPEGIRQLFRSFGEIDQEWKTEMVIAEGKYVVVRAINTCFQQSFFGIPTYGKPQVFSAMFIHRIENGKIAETWRNADDLGRLFQLGARPELIPDEQGMYSR